MGKGTRKGIEKFKSFALQVSKNKTKPCFVLKCDVRKFFANIDHGVLKKILQDTIQDTDILNLFGTIIDSFETEQKSNKGLPIGNLTSQLLVNIYMNEFDQFVKHKVKAKYYIRYADDFVFLSGDKKWLEDLLPQVSDFLESKLKLALHPNKVFIKTYASGVDFLSWVHFSNHRVLRTATKQRMFKKLKKSSKEEIKQSYLGMLLHGNTYKISSKIK